MYSLYGLLYEVCRVGRDDHMLSRSTILYDMDLAVPLI